MTAYPGKELGIPEEGPGSIGRFGRRLVAVFIDWAICVWAFTPVLAPGAGATARSMVALGVFAVANILLIGTAGFTLGQRLLGLRVATLDGGRPGLAVAFVRAVLLCLAIPPLIVDRDQRGVHDRMAGTVVLRL